MGRKISIITQNRRVEFVLVKSSVWERVGSVDFFKIENVVEVMMRRRTCRQKRQLDDVRRAIPRLLHFLPCVTLTHTSTRTCWLRLQPVRPLGFSTKTNESSRDLLLDSGLRPQSLRKLSGATFVASVPTSVHVCNRSSTSSVKLSHLSNCSCVDMRACCHSEANFGTTTDKRKHNIVKAEISVCKHQRTAAWRTTTSSADKCSLSSICSRAMNRDASVLVEVIYFDKVQSLPVRCRKDCGKTEGRCVMIDTAPSGSSW
ncbi:hypothetical protein F2P81_001570 [Scophthalmus maximus]|uniref:Uncharacterized protein n=1 Tax=Scophthalmus maximus TaxID=52904 RepID=A0A6A4TQJ6_SCOMX|nr:hypothetical protein F2P81_001570 [Scophthalmus maximus]